MSLFYLCVTLLLPAPIEAYEQAKALLDSGQPQKAVPLLEEAVLARPNWYYPLMLRGACYLQMGDFARAETDLKDAASLDMTDQERTTLRFYLGRALMSGNKFAEAADTFEAAAEKAPPARRFDLLLNAAQCVYRQARDAQAAQAVPHYRRMITQLDAALQSPPRSASAATAARQRGYAHLQLYLLEKKPADLATGIKGLESWLKTTPDDRDGNRMLFSLYHQRAAAGNAADYAALADLGDTYLSRWPDDADVRKKQGGALQAAGRYKEAAATLQKLTAQTPEDGEAHYMLGAALYKAENYAAAHKAFARAIDKGEADRAMCYTLAAGSLLHERSGCYTQDAARYREAVALLESGQSRAAGDTRDLLTQLDRTRKNLQILEENHQTDALNHQAVLENLPKLQENLTANRAKQRRLREKIVDFPALMEELSAQLREVEQAIAADETLLAAEATKLKQYLGDAERCGNGDGTAHYGAMKQLAASL